MPLFYSHASYTGDGETRVYNVPFPFIMRDYVIATVDKVPVAFEWLSNTSVSFMEAPAAGSKVLIYRDTGKEQALVDFNDGAVLTGSALNLEFTQLLHIAQETWDVPNNIRELADDLEVKMITDTEQAHQAIDAKVEEATGVISDKVTEAQATIQETSDTATGTIATAVSTAQTTIQEKVDGAIVTIDDKVLAAETAIQEKVDTSEAAIQTKVDTAVAALTTTASDAEAEIQAKADAATGTINDLVSANEATIGGYATAATEAAATATEIASGATAYVESTRQAAEAAALSATNAAASAQNAWQAEKNRVATTSETGVIKVGAGLSVDGEGLLEVAESVRTGIVADLTAVIDADSGVVAGDYGQATDSCPGHSESFSVPYIIVNSKGKITRAANRQVTLPSIPPIGTASASALGMVQIGNGLKITPEGILYLDPWDIYPLRSPLPVQGITLSGRNPIMPGETAARTNWLLCDGGTDGQGGNVPDLRGKFLLGADDNHPADSTGGSEEHDHDLNGSVGSTTLSVEQLASHPHTVPNYAVTDSSAPWGFTTGGGGRFSVKQAPPSTSSVGSSKSHTHNLSGSTASGGTLPPYYALAYLIRIK